LHGKLTLLSAPTGFGKTTLINNWIFSAKPAVAWLSLDERDNDSTRFWTYVVAALQAIEADIGDSALPLLQSSQVPPLESVLTTLINEVVLIPTEVALVLDDYHVIDSAVVDETLTFLLDHLPPQMHLIITTREDPNLPLARYRSRGQMMELRAADLRFTPTESAEFLNQVMGLSLSTEDISALETRTEGWIAGLQLAAISMQGRADPGRFIQAFTGSHHFILEYLIEEVLHGQPDHVRDFLLQTAILDQLSDPPGFYS
jgi:LuxR family maltose regulon positive regulatory protein